MTNNNDTICAVATAPGGAIGIIRVSGNKAIEITDKIFYSASSKNSSFLSTRKGYTLTFGQIKDNNDETIDEVLVSVFKAPHSYTGENSTEISCHGSQYILQKVIQLLIDNGCRAAEPGEFTRRAFLNGKMDLSQAEAVADLIASSTEAAHRLAMSQMHGAFSHKIADLRNQLLHLASLIELELDFSDHEELEFANRDELIEKASQTETLISHLINSFASGNAIKNGIPVAIIGPTNAGKSTLLNAIVGEERAIVSDIHGTTRDIIEDTVNIKGTVFRIIDTAGIRNTGDSIEAMGIERSFKALDKAGIVIILYDLEHPVADFNKFYDEIHSHLIGKTAILAMNKCDKNVSIPASLPSVIHNVDDDVHWNMLTISAKYGKGIKELMSLLADIAHLPKIEHDGIIITNARHYEALIHAHTAINRVIDGLSANLPSDLISQDIRECIFYLADIMGEVTSNDVLNNIFKNFCVGK